MTTINGNLTIYIKQLTNLQVYYSATQTNADNIVTGDWTLIVWPVTIKNVNSASGPRLVVNFITNITLSNVNNSFTLGVGSSYITIDGQNHIFTVASVPNWLGLIQGDGVNINIGNITIQKINIQTSGSTTLQNDGRGYVCGIAFGRNFSGTNVIDHCSNSGPISTFGGGILGGIGFNYSNGINSITNCTNTGQFTGINSGGICGNQCFDGCTNKVIINNCINEGTISAGNCGGIGCGMFTNQNTAVTTVTFCTNNGQIAGNNSAGILYYPYDGGSQEISNCLNTGTITGNNCAGIIHSDNYNYNTTLSIQNCENTGTVNTTSAGILLGYYKNLTLQNCFSNGNLFYLPYSYTIINPPVTPPTININNCYVLNGTYYVQTATYIQPPTITSCYKVLPGNNWDTSTAKNSLLLDPPVWVYDKLNGITDKSLPFLLQSLNNTYDVVVLPVFTYGINGDHATLTGTTGPINNGVVALTYSNLPVTEIIPNALRNITITGTINLSSVNTIGDNAFFGCSGLTGTLNLSNVTSIGKSAFLGCGFSGELTLSPLLEVLEEGVFDRCSFTSLAPPTNLRSIGAYAFYDNPMFVYDFTQCDQLAYIDPSAFNMSGRYDFLDVNVYVSSFTYERIRNIPFPKYVKLHTGVPVSNICFIAGTLVKTDQGNLPIQSLTRKNTLCGQPIQVTKTKHDDPYLVKIKAYAFTDTPTKDTYMSMNHRVYFNRVRVKARDLVNGDTVTLVDYHGEPLYNVLVKAHTHMEVHGMIVETLDPTSVIALLYTSKLSPNQKTLLIEKMNRQKEYDDIVIHLKRNQ